MACYETDPGKEPKVKVEAKPAKKKSAKVIAAEFEAGKAARKAFREKSKVAELVIA